MRCCSCGANVPPEFVHAIQKNVCPGCGGPIMTSDSQELLHELSSAIERMPNDPQGVAGWLLSNYRFKKIGAAEPTEHFHRAQPQAQQRNQDRENDYSNLKTAPNLSEQLLERTGLASRIKNTQSKISSLAGNGNNKIAQAAAAIMQQQGEEEGFDMPENIDDTTIEDIRAYQELVRNGFGRSAAPPPPFNPPPQQAPPSNALAMTRNPMDMFEPGRATVGRGDDELLPEEMAIANSSERGRQAVMNARLKRIKAQDAIESGGGSFRRAG